MKRKLTNEEIDRLYDFCSKHYVVYYDLQVELVDHLASGIEAQWETEDIAFETALNNVFKKFGIHGFSYVRMEQEKALRRKYRKIYYGYLREYFKLPKLIITVAGTLIVYSIYQVWQNDSAVSIFLAFVYLIYACTLSYISLKKNSLKLSTEKRFLFKNVYNGMMSQSAILAIIPFHAFNVFNTFFDWGKANPINATLELIISFVAVFLMIILYIFSVDINNRMKEDFRKEFPEYIVS